MLFCVVLNEWTVIFHQRLSGIILKKKRRQYNNRGTDCRTLKPPCGEPRAVEAEKLLCISIIYVQIEVIKTPVFVISQIIIITSNNRYVR